MSIPPDLLWPQYRTAYKEVHGTTPVRKVSQDYQKYLESEGRELSSSKTSNSRSPSKTSSPERSPKETKSPVRSPKKEVKSPPKISEFKAIPYGGATAN